eukprot:scaffold10371_cov60-Cyclotella_meneghiniana.AAC.3
MNEQLSIKIALCDGVDLLIVTFLFVALESTLNQSPYPLKHRLVTGLGISGVSIRHPNNYYCCVICRLHFDFGEPQEPD